MAITIFSRESGSTEEWLVVNDDCTVTHHTENTGWRMARRGMEASEAKMSVEEAKLSWPSYATAIDNAVARIRTQKTGK